MKIISYNLNGIRSAISKGLFDWLAEEQPDVFCIQESKAQPDQIDVMTMQEIGYHSYIHSAEKKGYSGVAIFTRTEPDRVVVGMNNPKYDCQGRVIRADYGDVTVVCVYIPSGESEGPKYEYKMDFLEDFLVWINELRKDRPNIVVCGDYNIFRMFDLSGEKYSWWSFRAASRARNVGWRIDYHWVSEPLKERVSDAKILNEVVHSDHCPVAVWID